MTPLEMIEEWRKGCTCAGPAYDKLMCKPEGTTHQAECHACTIGLINAIEKHLLHEDRIAPCGLGSHFYRVLDRLRDAACLYPKDPSTLRFGPLTRMVKREDLAQLLEDYDRMDAELRRQYYEKQRKKPDLTAEEEHRVG